MLLIDYSFSRRQSVTSIKFKIHRPFEPATPLLELSSIEIKAAIHKDISMFDILLFAKAKTWQQSE